MKIEDRTTRTQVPARPPEPARRPAEPRTEVRAPEKVPERAPEPEKGRRIDTRA